MATKNMDATIRFWRDLLGMRLVAGLGRLGYRHYFFEISQHDMVAFFEWSGVENIPEKDHGVPVKGPFAFDHVSLEVDTEEDIWELKAKLEAADIWVSEVVDHGFIYSIYTFDPNHIPIEFSVPVRDADVRSHPQMKDAAPTGAALEGPDPRPGIWPEGHDTIPAEERIVYPGEGRILIDKGDDSR